jgi:hypothetical protein
LGFLHQVGEVEHGFGPATIWAGYRSAVISLCFIARANQESSRRQRADV